MSKRKLLFLFCLFSFFGCAGDYIQKTSPRFQELKPATIAVMPVMNETVDLDAPKEFLSLVRRELSSKGYRLTDQSIIDERLNEEGIFIAEEARSIPDAELGKIFSADAIMYTTVTSWETVYLGVYASVTVGARFQLVDAKTSEILWIQEDEVKDIAIAVDKKTAEYTAAFAVLQSYEPYVRRLVHDVFTKMPGRF